MEGVLNIKPPPSRVLTSSTTGTGDFTSQTVVMVKRFLEGFEKRSVTTLNRTLSEAEGWKR